MTGAQPTLSGQLTDVLTMVARLRLSLPDAEVVGEVLPFWPDEFEGMYALQLAGGGRGRVVVVMVDGGDIVPHAGLHRAAAWLHRLRVLERPPPHTTESIRPILDAVGGLSPGFPDHPDESFEHRSDSGVRIVFSEPADRVQFAASGGMGPPPTERVTGFGIRAPVPPGRMVCDIDPDYRLSWSYTAGDSEVGSFVGRPDLDRPDEAGPQLTERLLGAARVAARRPWAVPAGPLRRRASTGETAQWEVAFLGGGSVTVSERHGEPCGIVTSGD